jgi:transformation/transcription domain-associated protein
VLLRLFKLVFGSVTIFAENEPVLQPHLSTIITAAMKHATEVKDSTNYFVLLRALFRSIGGGKFDQFFKEFLPLLPALLEGLNRLQNSSHSQNMRDLFVELALSVPVRLSALLPCLRLLMRPLVIALDSGNELVLQGLRTLELCIDNLSPDFLDPILSEVKTELLQGLWKHLKPAPYPHGPQVVRIMGKLGGRNRRFLLHPTKWKNELEEHAIPLLSAPGVDGLVLQLPLSVMSDAQPTVSLSFDRLIQLSKQKLLSSPDLDVKRNSFLFLQTCLNLLLACHLKVDYKGPESAKYATKIKLESEEVILKTLFDCVIVASSNEKLADVAVPFFEDLNRHFAVMFCNKNSKDILPISDIYIESLVDGIKSENRTYTKTVLKGVDILIESCSEILGSLEHISTRIQEFDEIAKKLSHCCYKQDWFVKSGGSMGISHLCTKMPVSWIIRHEVLFTKSLLFILKDLLPEVSVVTIEEASQTLKLVLNICNSNYVTTDTMQVEQFQEVVGVLSNELSHTNSTVRSNVQKSLQLLSELSKQPISVLLEPFKQIILGPIFAKTLRTLPFIIQTGYLDALTFCLKLQPPLLSFNAELVRLLQSALGLAEKDDLASAKSMTQKSMQILNNLRTVSLLCFTKYNIFQVSIELLSAAMGCTEFQVPEHQEFRNRIIGVFFKALTLRSKEIVNVAKAGLTQVVSQQKLPKELLQSSLRPVLLNLADYRKLSVPLLQGLSRLLELLTNCFNVTLGEKLLEHLNKWTDPAKIAATKLWKDGEDIKIAACIVEIFHLLPAAASKFLDPLVVLTIQLELQLPREVSSPYRVPLIKFLNRYPTESVDYFLQRLIQPEYSKLFRFLVREETATSLRAELAKKPEKLIAATFHYSNPNTTALEAQFQGLLLVRTLVKYIPEWLSQNQSVLDCLVDIWKSSARSSRLTNDDNLPLHYLRESKLLIKCFLNYCRFNKQEVDVLFHMLSIFTVRSTIDYTFLKEFYTIEVADSYSPQEKKSILLRFLQVFKEPTLIQEHKVQALQILVIPMLTASFAKSETETVDQKIIASIISILEPKPGEIYEESLNIELLQLATLLVRFMPSDLVEHRKELIKFAWNHLKSEDTTTRHCAYVLVCRFIEAYDTPPKIILQVYVALLRAFQPEAKTLVKQALDVLTPAIYKRLPAGSDAKFPPWIKWTRKIILEEGHSLPQLIHILQLIVRHPQIFYSWRAQFVPHMVNSLARIGLLPNSPHENRKLAVDLAELIISWEKQRITESEQQKESSEPSNNNNTVPTTDSMEIEGAKSLTEDTTSPMDLEDKKDSKEGSKAPAPGNQEEFKASTTISEMIVNFLIRIASTSTDNTASSNSSTSATGTANAASVSTSTTTSTTVATGTDFTTGLPQRALELLKSALTLWPDVYIKFAFFEKLLVTATTEQATIVCTGIAILNVIFDYQIHKLVTENLASLQSTLTPSITSTNMKVYI